jgi:Ca2+-binding RTX toxin-like protein
VFSTKAPDKSAPSSSALERSAPFIASDKESADANLTYNVSIAPADATKGTLGSVAGQPTKRTFDSAQDFNGRIEIHYTVTDRGDPDACSASPCDAPEISAQGSVTVTVNPVNDAPTVTVSGGQCLSNTNASGTLNFTVADVDIPPLNSLVLSATSSDTTLIPDGNLVPGGNGTNSANRSLNLSALPKKNGTATITVSVSDGTATTTLPVTVWVGTQASETITGAAGTDVIFGLGGSGILEGGAGPDLICGGNGNDTARGGGGHDVLDGGRGDDRLNGGAGNDRLLGKAGTDTLTGGSGSDTATDFDAPEGDTQDNTTESP